MKKTFAILICLSFLGAPATAGDLEFIDSPFANLLIKKERKVWKKTVKSSEDAQRFVQLFWAKRDPSPGTWKNEFREEKEKLVETALRMDEVAEGDQMKVFVLLGPPSGKKEMSIAEWQSTKAPTDASGDRTATLTGGPSVGARFTGVENGSATLWLYGDDRRPDGYNERGHLVAAFLSERGTVSQIEYQLDPTRQVLKAMELARKNAIIDPKMSKAPDWATKAPAAAIAQAIPAPQPTEAAPVAPPEPEVPAVSDQLTPAMIEATAGDAIGQGALFFNDGLTSTQEAFTSILLSSAEAPAGASFWGEVKDSAGEVAARFNATEEQAYRVEAHGEVYHGHSVRLAPGEYKVVAGLATADGVHSAVTSELEVADLGSDELVVSSLTLTRAFQPLTEKQLDDQPFCFNNNQVLPVGSGTFGPTEGLFYFFVVHNPTLSADDQPSIKTAFIIREAESKKDRLKTPFTEVAVQKMNEKSWIVGSEIPLDRLTFLEDGEWNFIVRVQDALKEGSVAKRTSANFTFASGQ